MTFVRTSSVLLMLVLTATTARAQQITAAGQPAQIDIRAAGDRSIRVTLKPLSFKPAFPEHPAIVERTYPSPALTAQTLSRPVQRTIAGLRVELKPNPMTLVVTNSAGRVIQEIVFESDGTLSFKLDDQPLL